MKSVSQSHEDPTSFDDTLADNSIGIRETPPATETAESNIPLIEFLQESKAEEQYRLLSQQNAQRAEMETAHLLTTVADHDTLLATEVVNHLQGMQKFMAKKLRRGGVFVEGGFMGTVDRLVEADRVKKAEVAEKARQHQNRLMQMALESKAEIEKQKRTGKGRRRLAVLEGGTGDIPVAFLTTRQDFRPVPTSLNSSTMQTNISKPYYEASSDSRTVQSELENDADDDVLAKLEGKLEAMKLQLYQTTEGLERRNLHEQEPAFQAALQPQTNSVGKRAITAKKFVKVDSSSSLLSRGVSAAIVRRTSGKAGPRVPPEVAAIWKAKEEGRFDSDFQAPTLVLPPSTPHALASPTKPKHLDTRRNRGTDFVSFSDSANILSLKQVLEAQNAKIERLAEEVLGPLDPPSFVPVKHVSMAAESLIAPEPTLETNTNSAAHFNTLAEFDALMQIDEPQSLRKCDPPPEPVIFHFPHSSARLLDARNRRINPSETSKVFQPKLPTNLQSIKIQSSIHNISQPPTLSVAALAGTNKTADACMKNQFKMAPTLSSEMGWKPNPVVEFEERKVVGSLGSVFGLSGEELSVADSVLKKLGVESKHAKVDTKGGKSR
ncbi:hypothetical protein HDU98_000944 [Podochytrium sp. JEL0797]|nr:hypothetical protein HDU98_000944 [Podochytrium sp. JEL0797]